MSAPYAAYARVAISFSILLVIGVIPITRRPGMRYVIFQNCTLCDSDTAAGPRAKSIEI
jgi:hypothetical protein